MSESLPTRGGWIEIWTSGISSLSALSPSPHGEGGLKYEAIFQIGNLTDCPSPHGEGGLKCTFCKPIGGKGGVPPHTGRVD